MNFDQAFNCVSNYYKYLKKFTNPSLKKGYELFYQSFIEQEQILNNITSEFQIQNLYNKVSESKNEDYEFQIRQLLEIAMGKRKIYVHSYPVLYSLKMGIDHLGSQIGREAWISNISFIVEAIDEYIRKKIF